MLGGKLKTLNAKIIKEKRFKVNDITFHFKKQDKEEQIKYTVSRRKEIKIRVDISEIENNKENSKPIFGSLNK